MENRNNESLKRIDEMFSFIEQSFAMDEEVTMDDISRILCESKQSGERIFRFLTGYTFKEYIKRRQLSIAALELYKKDSKVLDIAVKYGYSSSQAFSRTFKKFFGHKPSEIHNKSLSLKMFVPQVIVEKLESKEFQFEIVCLESFSLFSKPVFAGERSEIGKHAREFWKNCDVKNWVGERYGFSQVVSWQRQEYCYYAASDKPFDGATPFMFKKSRWAIFHFNKNEIVRNNIFSIEDCWKDESGLKRDITLPIIEKYLKSETQIFYPITFC